MELTGFCYSNSRVSPSWFGGKSLSGKWRCGLGGKGNTSPLGEGGCSYARDVARTYQGFFLMLTGLLSIPGQRQW